MSVSKIFETPTNYLKSYFATSIICSVLQIEKINLAENFANEKIRGTYIVFKSLCRDQILFTSYERG